MTEQEAQRFIDLMLAVPDARNAEFQIGFRRDGQDAKWFMRYTASFFIGKECYLANGATPDEAIVEVIQQWAVRPKLVAVGQG